MKPASLTITYIVYEKDYVPGKRFTADIESKVEAHAQCRKYGPGSEIVRVFDRSNRRRSSSVWDRREWVYQGERIGRYRKRNS